MTRNKWLWVAIKALGVYLIVCAVLAIPNWLAFSLMYLDSLKFSSEISELMRRNHASGALVAGFRGLFCGLAGIYFLRSGKAFMSWAALGPQPPAETPEAQDDGESSPENDEKQDHITRRIEPDATGDSEGREE